MTRGKITISINIEKCEDVKLKKQKIYVLSLMFIITILLLIIYNRNPSAIPIAVKGEADLSKTDFEKKQIIDLDGEWEFYWNQLLEPADFIENKQGEPNWIKIPGNWIHDQKGNTYSAKGYATYRLNIKNIPSKTYFGLKKENIRNASRIFVNGELLLEDGKPAESIEDSVAGNNPQIVYFELTEQTAEIIVQAVNYEYVVGGIANSVVFGQQKALMKKNHRQIIFETIIITILISIGIIHLCILLAIKNYRKRELAVLPFALSCVFFGIMNGFLSQRILAFLFPWLTFEMIFKTFYFAIYGGLLMNILYINKMNSAFLQDKIRNMLAGIYGLYLMGIILLPMNAFMKIAGFFMFFNMAVLLALFLWILYLYLKEEPVETNIRIHSILLFALFSINIYTVDLSIYSVGLKKDMFIGFISIVSYSLALMFLLIVRYAEAYEKNEEMSIKLMESYYNLDKTVEKARRNEIAFLQAQIKPHFLFNAMSSVISLCYTDGVRARKILTELMNYLKRSFDVDHKSDYITIESELNLIKSFVEIEKERFGDRIKISLDIDPDSLPLKIIPLVIEPLVENAIRHGVLKNKQGGIVGLTIMKRNGKIFVSVEDNGKGMSDRQIENIMQWDEADGKTSPGSGIGLSNINNRLKRFYGEELHFETGQQGTKVYFTIPFTEKMEEDIDDQCSYC